MIPSSIPNGIAKFLAKSEPRNQSRNLAIVQISQRNATQEFPKKRGLISKILEKIAEHKKSTYTFLSIGLLQYTEVPKDISNWSLGMRPEAVRPTAHEVVSRSFCTTCSQIEEETT